MRTTSIVLTLFIVAVAQVQVAHAQRVQRIKPDLTIDLGEKATSAGGLVFDGKQLWVSSQSLGKDLLLSYDVDGKPGKRLEFDHAGNMGGGLAYDGTDYMILDYRNRIALAGGEVRFTGKGEIVRLSKSGELESLVFLPTEMNNTFGLAFHKGDLYFGHSPTVRPSATIYKVAAKAVVGDGVKVDYYVRSLMSDGTSMWVSTMDHIHRLNDDATIADSYVAPFKTAGIAWDGTHLWALEHNENKLHRFPAGAVKGAAKVEKDAKDK